MQFSCILYQRTTPFETHVQIGMDSGLLDSGCVYKGAVVVLYVTPPAAKRPSVGSLKLCATLQNMQVKNAAITPVTTSCCNSTRVFTT